MRPPAPEVGPQDKWCRRCDLVLNKSSFTGNVNSWDGRQTYCRSCVAQMYRERRESGGHVVRPADILDGHKFCRSCEAVLPLSEWTRRTTTKDGYACRCKVCMTADDKRKHLARTYGISVADLDAMLAAQGGVCAICLSAPAVHVDHHHGTGQIRGVLCFRCNAAIGQLGDNPDVIRRAAAYVELADHCPPPPHDAVG